MLATQAWRSSLVHLGRSLPPVCQKLAEDFRHTVLAIAGGAVATTVKVYRDKKREREFRWTVAAEKLERRLLYGKKRKKRALPALNALNFLNMASQHGILIKDGRSLE